MDDFVELKPTMNERRTYSQCRNFFLTGISLVCIAFFAPDAAENPAGGFFQYALKSSWGHLLNLPAAWCSFKIVILSLGLFLIVECLGTILAVAGQRRLAWTVYSLHLVSGAGFLVGSYYFIKALL